MRGSARVWSLRRAFYTVTVYGKWKRAALFNGKFNKLK
jgi:hypothetical protein